MKTFFYFLIFSLVAIMSSCGKMEQKEDKEKSHAEEKNPDEVSLTEEQYKTVGIQLGKMEHVNLISGVKATGTLELPPNKRASVSSFIGGVIKQINVIPGTPVKKGQTLVILEHPDIIRLQQNYLEAKSKFEYAEKEYLRQKELHQEKIVAGKKFQLAEADYQAQLALVSSLENQLIEVGIFPKSISKGNIVRSISIKSPLDGFVHKVNVNLGSYVDPTREILTVVDNSHIHVDLQVFERDISKIAVGQKVYFTLSNTTGSEEYIANIYSVGRAFDMETKSVLVHADIKNNVYKNLLPGMFVNARIAVDTNTVDALPNEAVFAQGDLKYIFIKAIEDEKQHQHEKPHQGEMHFQRIQIKTGTSDGGYTEIIPLQPLPKNAEIVVKGAYFLMGQMKQGEEGGGDEHGH